MNIIWPRLVTQSMDTTFARMEIHESTVNTFSVLLVAAFSCFNIDIPAQRTFE